MKLEQIIRDFEEVLAYDPGATTGFARISIDRARTRILINDLREFPKWRDIENHIQELTPGKHCIVYESFNIRTPGHKVVLEHVNHPIEVIGVIKFLCTKYGIDCYSQEPAERLIVDNWYGERIMRQFPSHYGSAIRHAIFFAVKRLFKKPAQLEYNPSINP